jgi:hypothetical protein
MAVLRATKPGPEAVIVERASSTLPQSTQTAYFTVSGRVLVTALVGEVTVVIQSQATTLQWVANPTVGADVTITSTGLDANAHAVGQLYGVTGTFASAIDTRATAGLQPGEMMTAPGMVIADGTLDLKTVASSTGETKWTLHYIPLDAGSTVVAA